MTVLYIPYNISSFVIIIGNSSINLIIALLLEIERLNSFHGFEKYNSKFSLVT